MNSPSASLGFVSHPYHRGGVTRWMVDAFGEWRRRGNSPWFVVPKPNISFPSGGGRPLVAELLWEIAEGDHSGITTPRVTALFELGTSAFRARMYARAILSGVAPGVPLIVSDDADVWKGATLVAGRNPIIGVLHADDVAYYSLARKHGHSLGAAVAVSKRIASCAEPILSIHGIPIATIPCGVSLDGPLVENDAPREAARIIWIGRIEERQKRVSDLWRIAAGLRQQGIRFVLSIVGDGPEALALRRQLEVQQLEKQVELHGWLPGERVQELLRAGDVLLLPSNFEGMPVVAMEALGAGCAVVASRVSGLEDYEASEMARDAIFLHDVGDVDAAVNATIVALSRPEAVRRTVARNLAEHEFTIERCMDRYAELLPSVRSRVNLETVQLGLVSGALTAARAGGVAAARAVRRLLPS